MKNCLAKYNYTKKIRLSRLWYYLISLLKLYRAIKLKSFFQFTLQLFAGDTKIVHLRNYDLKFKLKSMLDVLTLKEVVIDDEYESLGVRIDKKDKVIVDIGAGFGDFAILVSKRHPLAKIFAFEPDPFYFGLLKENIKLNKARNIFPFKESIFSLKQVFNPIQSNPIQSNPIQSNPISSLQCDFLKMDCEGCEFSIVNNKDSIYLKRIKKIVMEYHESSNCNVSCLTGVLIKAGYKVKIFPRRNVEDIGLLIAVRFNL